MRDHRAGHPRVLLGHLEPMVCLGMSRVLSDEGVDVIMGGDSDAEIVARVERVQPDAVVLGMQAATSRTLGDRLRAGVPTIKVILWPRDEDAMEVLDGADPNGRRVHTSLFEALRREVQTSKVLREGA